MAYCPITISAYLIIFLYFVCENYVLLPGFIFAMGMLTVLEKVDLLPFLRTSSLHCFYQSLASLVITHVMLTLVWWPIEGLLLIVIAVIGDLINVDGEDPKVVFTGILMAACIFLAWATDVKFLRSSSTGQDKPTPPPSTANPNHHKNNPSPMPGAAPTAPRSCRSAATSDRRSRSRRRC